MNNSLKIIFAGTPDFSAHYLEVLLNSMHKIVMVLTQPDRPAGRGNKLMQSPVKILAKKNDILVFQPNSLFVEDSYTIISKTLADIIVVVAYGLLLPKNIINIPPLGCINVHPSLLPRWRGAAPIQRALLAGDNITGISIMKMDTGLDTGDILNKIICPISIKDTSKSLHAKLAKLGSKLLLDTLLDISANRLNSYKQNEELSNYAEKINKIEARVNWQLSAAQLERCVRAFNPWPMSYLKINNKTIKILEVNVLPHVPDKKLGEIIKIDKYGIQVATSNGILNIEKIQLEGKNPVSVQDFLNSHNTLFTLGFILN